MGVPRFFKWLIDHYKENRIILTDLEDRTIDRLFLDANGIFHPQCFKTIAEHPKVQSIERLEKMMFERITKYIDYLFFEAAPKKEMVISVDGVAPLAKMNQQRKRRFRAVDDAILEDEIRERHGEKKKSPWRNTVITPGTDFMERLMAHLKRYADAKTAETKVRVRLSSYHEAGEGEHKIISYIRRLRDSHPGEAYAITGLDADLIFLGLGCGVENVYLMRETQQLGNVGKKTADKLFYEEGDVAEEINYIDLSETKRCYIEQLDYLIVQRSKSVGVHLTIDPAKQKGLIADYIFICYFLGNDFLPHIPSLSISHGGLDRLLNIYADLYLKTQTTMIEFDGDRIRFDQPKLAEFLTEIAKFETVFFRKELPKYESRWKKRRCFSSDPLERELWNLQHMKKVEIHDPIDFGRDGWEARYYDHYFKIRRREDRRELTDTLCRNYFEGIVWTAYYYFVDCPAWDWQYRSTHAPLLNDLAAYLSSDKIDLNAIEFGDSAPLKPIEQLMAVLPPKAIHLLPPSYRKHVTASDSSIGDLYPRTLELDMIHKGMYWECIPMMPPVDPRRIEAAVSEELLDQKEKKRNIVSGSNL